MADERGDPTCVPLLLEVSVPVELAARLDMMLRGAIARARKQFGKRNDGEALEKILEVFHEEARRLD